MRKITRTRIFLLGLCLLFFISPRGVASDVAYTSKELFPLPPQLEDAVQFWVKVYTQYRTNEYVIHDAERLNLTYEVVRLGPQNEETADFHPSQADRDFLSYKKDYYVALLTQLASPQTDLTNLAGDKRRLFDLFGASADHSVYSRAASNVRAQRGQKARFLKGLELSGRYLEYMKRIFRAYSVPEELTFLPHVESSFHYRAYSPAGAAGIWQFTQPTGRRYLNITYEIDERLDPLLATAAAARLLKYNYEACGSWPLAITAYNHGLEGMQRAMQLLNTSDMARIVAEYKGPCFGFASRNFYCEFLAALHVVQHYQDYFGNARFDPPVRFGEVEVPKYAKMSTLARHLRVNTGLLSELNPGLRRPVFNGTRYLPRGYRLRVPPHLDAGPLIAQIPSSELFLTQKRTNWYRVDKGDTLGEISERHGTSLATLVALNGLDNAHRIRVGQVIRLPDKASSDTPSSSPKTVVASLSAPPSKDDPATGPSQPQKEAVPSADRAQEQEQPNATEGVSPALAHAATNPSVKVVKRLRPSVGYIRVEPDETLAHYADWLKLPANEIRRLNHFSPKRNVRYGQWIKVMYNKVTPEDFQVSRLEYRRGIGEDFYNNYKILGTFTHCLKKGENIWDLCGRVYDVPYWLVMQYNNGIDLSTVKPGDTIVIPRISDGNTSS